VKPGPAVRAAYVRSASCSDGLHWLELPGAGWSAWAASGA
jgi:hypothetical protein